MKEDVLREFLNRLIDAYMRGPESFGETVMRSVEQEVRHDWAGTESLIRKDPDREHRRRAARAEIERGTPVREIVSKTGLSRTQVYALFKKRN